MTSCASVPLRAGPPVRAGAENVPPVNVTGLPAPQSAGTVSVPWNPDGSFFVQRSTRLRRLLAWR